MFEPVTMTRAASAADGVGAAPMSVDSGARFWANAFDAIMRGIPTQAVRVMRRNPNLECPVLVMVSPSFEVRVSLNCHTIVTIQNQATKKNPRGWQDYFLLFENIFAKNRRPCAYRTSKQRLPKSKQFLVSDATSPATLASPFQQILTKPR